MVLLDSEFLERGRSMKMDKTNKKESGTNRRKFRRGLPDSLGALSSLVSFDDAELEESRDGWETDTQKRTTMTERPSNMFFECNRKLTRISSEPNPSGTLDYRGAPTLRNTLSQDWFATNFSPRPGREPRRGLVWGSDCWQSEQLLRHIPSLRSIPEESELDHDDGSELSDENIIVEVDSRRKSVHGKQDTPAAGSIEYEHERDKKSYSSQLEM